MTNTDEKMRVVRLKNGGEEFQPLVLTVMLALEGLMATDPIALYELAMTCRDARHKPWGQTGTALQRLSLMQPDGKVHDSIQNVVLSCVEGEGIHMKLVDPRADTDDSASLRRFL